MISGQLMQKVINLHQVINNSPMKKIALQIVMSLIIIVLAYFVYESIMGPVRFNREKAIRTEATIQVMKDIRDLQLTYKSIHGRYMGSFDTLIDFAMTGQIPVVNIIPDPNDTTFTKTINDTIGYESVYESLFGDRKDYKIGDIRFVPFSDGDTIQLSAGTMTKANIEVNVFEAIAPKTSYLKGLDKVYIRRDNVKDIVLGSMTEPSTDGNWE